MDKSDILDIPLEDLYVKGVATFGLAKSVGKLNNYSRDVKPRLGDLVKLPEELGEKIRWLSHLEIRALKRFLEKKGLSFGMEQRIPSWKNPDID